ncbi:MAG: hypothetical protein WB586_12400 [Chthoniobacterales bacterium]
MFLSLSLIRQGDFRKDIDPELPMDIAWPTGRINGAQRLGCGATTCAVPGSVNDEKDD